MKKILVFLTLLGVVIAGMAATKPDDMRVERSIVIKAPASEVFSQVNVLKKWDSWSPWAKLDPNAKVTFEGPLAGKGAVMRWDGNSSIGKGVMAIVESHENQMVKYALVFEAPMAGKSTSEMTLTEKDGKTTVVWSMYGKNNFMAKVMSLVFNCEKMIGEKYEEGLTNLKSLVETE